MLFYEMYIFCSVLGTNIFKINLKRHCENWPCNKKGLFLPFFLPVVAVREAGFTCLWLSRHVRSSAEGSDLACELKVHIWCWLFFNNVKVFRDPFLWPC